MKQLSKNIIFLFSLQSLKRRWQLLLLVIINILSALSEVLTISSVIPLFQVMVSEEGLGNHVLIHNFTHYFQDYFEASIETIVITFFIVAVIIASLLKTLWIWFSARYSYAIGHELSLIIIRSYLRLPYYKLNNIKSSEFMADVIGKTESLVGYIIAPIVSMLSALFILTICFGMLLYFIPEPTLILTFFFAVSYGCIVAVQKNKMRSISKEVNFYKEGIVNVLQESFNAIRDVILSQKSNEVVNNFANNDKPLRQNQATVQFFANAPKSIIEGLLLLVMAIIGLRLIQSNGIEAFGIIGALAIAGQRLLPYIQQIYASLVNTRAGAELLKSITFIIQESENHPSQNQNNPIKFEQSIDVNIKSFSHYGETESLYKDLKITINKGEKIALIGPSGSGKSTLLDIICGLLPLDNGHLKVDGIKISPETAHNWWKNIGYVSQYFALQNTTIIENVVWFKKDDEINIDHVYKCLIQAGFSQQEIDELDVQNRLIGENGNNLSGGQRQRVAIARTLYMKPKLLILDEVTSALDAHSRKKVIDTIKNLPNDLTIVAVTHQTDFKSVSDRCFEMKKHQLFQVNSD